MKGKLLLLTFFIQVCLAGPSQAQTIYLSIASSMTDAFRDIIASFSTTHPATILRPNFASSGSLAKQIVQGAPADLYISANPQWLRYLIEHRLTTVKTTRIFAYNGLVFIGAETKAGASSLAELPSLERIAIGNPNYVPAGQYARQVMEKAGIYSELVQKKKIIMAKDVRQALLYADRGEVDGAFVYKTDALLITQAKILFTVPQTLYDRVSYPVALTVSGAKKDEATALYDYINSPKAQAILSNYGFEVNNRTAEQRN